MNKVYIGIDNGSSGSIGVVGLGAPRMFLPPVKVEQDYTKKAKNITRIDWHGLQSVLMKEVVTPVMELNCGVGVAEAVQVKALVERPFVNPGMFNTTVCAVRAFESTVIALEFLGIPWEPIDSKVWQKVMLPEGIKGAANLKRASRDIGMRTFPEHAVAIKKHTDADGLLIAEWAHRVQR